jgi:ketosteroid isomerase-like protein
VDTPGLMSEQSQAADAVALVRRYSDAVARRDFDDVEDCFAPNARCVTAASGTLEGRAAVRAMIEEIVGSYETWEIDEGEEVRSVGNGVVLAIFTIKGRWVGGVGELRSPFASVSVIADGLIAWHAHYTDAEEARRSAAGLAEARG